MIAAELVDDNNNDNEIRLEICWQWLETADYNKKLSITTRNCWLILEISDYD